jgi:hypothetical protein
MTHLSGEFVLADEVAGGEDEDFADHVGVLLVAAHEPDHAPVGSMFDDGFEALAHDLLERHALVDHGLAAPAFVKRLLDAGEAAAQEAYDEVVLVVRLGLGWALAVVLLQQCHESVGDRGESITARTLSGFFE